jgi:hypothetical protein
MENTGNLVSEYDSNWKRYAAIAAFLDGYTRETRS